MDVTSVDPDTITVSPLNERKETVNIDNTDDSLLDSVEQTGVIQPVILRPYNDGDAEYEVVVGQRRVTAAQAAGLDDVPAVIMEWDDRNAIVASITENIDAFQERVSTTDRAAALKALWKEMGNDGRPNAAELADELGGVTRQTVNRWLEPLREEWEGTEVHPEAPPETETTADDLPTETDDDTVVVDDPDVFDDDPIDTVDDYEPGDNVDDGDADDEDEDDTVTSEADVRDEDEIEPGDEDPNPFEDELDEGPAETDTTEGTVETEQNAADDAAEADVETRELQDAGTGLMAAARRITDGNPDQAVPLLKEFQKHDLSQRQVRELERRLDNKSDADPFTELETMLAETEETADESSKVYVEFTVVGEVADALEAYAADEEVSPAQAAEDIVTETLTETDYL